MSIGKMANPRKQLIKVYIYLYQDVLISRTMSSIKQEDKEEILQAEVSGKA